MKAFLDTSVLVAVFYAGHQHHERSLDLFLRFGKAETCCGAHSLAEVYSVLTGRIGKDRVSGDEALLYLHDVRDHLSVVSLKPAEYFRCVEQAAALALAGGAIHDSVLAHCGLSAGAEAIYTWNVKHFERFGPEIASRVRTP